ncbi:hypothetical protein J1614_012194 [Plenodomus biglobosus]|nr:hypothetical protein J1614_012194 [Plenodomus biglobosus]
MGCALAAITYAVWQGANYFLTIQLQDLGFTAFQTSIRFLPLGIAAFALNMIIPQLLAPVGAPFLLLFSWLPAIAGVALLAFVGSTDDYWRLSFPGMILYIISSPPAGQGSVAGVFHMSLNVGGAVFGMAVLTVIANSVTDNNGGQGLYQACLRGY